MFASLDLALVHKLVVVFLSVSLILTSLFASLIVILLLVSTSTASALSTLVVASTGIARLLVVAVALLAFVRVVLSGFLSDLHDCDLTFVIEIACGSTSHRIDRGLRSQLMAILFFIILGIL